MPDNIDSINKKLEFFNNEAETLAKRDADAILADVAEKRSAKLENGRREIDAEAAERLDAGLKAMRRANAREFALESTRLREELLHGREEVIGEVVRRVREMLLEFTKSPGYRDYIIGICVGAVKKRAESFTIYLSEADAVKYKFDILRALDDYQEDVAQAVGYTEQLSPVYTVMPDRGIKLGGVKLLSAEGGVFINETLDENLRLGRERLSKSGRLTAGETSDGDTRPVEGDVI